MGTAVKLPVPDRVKPSFLIVDIRALTPERQSARMSKITNDGLTRSGTGSFTAVPIWQYLVSKGLKQVYHTLDACCLQSATKTSTMARDAHVSFVNPGWIFLSRNLILSVNIARSSDDNDATILPKSRTAHTSFHCHQSNHNMLSCLTHCSNGRQCRSWGLSG